MAEKCVERAPESLSQPEKVKQLVYLSKTKSSLCSRVGKKGQNAASSEVKTKRQVEEDEKKFPGTEIKELSAMLPKESVW